MKQFDKFSSAKIKTGGFETLPKGAYVLKIIGASEEQNKSGVGSHIKVAFDIAEGEYKGFYKKQFDGNANEDKKWPMDGVYNLNAPDDNSPQWMIDNFGTFVAALEDSNSGYHWDWDEKRWKGLVIGALFRNEPSQADDGTVYDHMRPHWFRNAQDVRDKKCGKLPRDKQLKGAAGKTITGNEPFMQVDAAPGEDAIPF